MSEEMAEALEHVRKVADARGAEVVRSSELSRQDRELLVANQWLQEIIRGWYLLTRPDVAVGDSGPWYSHFWDFLRCYLEERFAEEYCLSAESSLGLHTGKTLVPEQVVVIVKKGGGNPVSLPFGTSLLVYADKANFPAERERFHGLQVMPLPLALARLAPAFYKSEPQEVQLALQAIPDISDLVRVLLGQDLRKSSSRLIEALRAIGEESAADRLFQELTSHGMRLPRIENPFETAPHPSLLSRSPYAARIESGWANLRESEISQLGGS